MSSSAAAIHAPLFLVLVDLAQKRDLAARSD
jgi:hypothetical protein